MTQPISYSTSMNARHLRAPFLSDAAMDYWGVIRRTVSAMTLDKNMKTTCRAAAQLLPQHGNPANALLARFV